MQQQQDDYDPQSLFEKLLNTNDRDSESQNKDKPRPSRLTSKLTKLNEDSDNFQMEYPDDLDNDLLSDDFDALGYTPKAFSN